MKSKPLVGPPPLENGFEEIAVSLAVGLRGEGGSEGDEGVVEERVRPLKWFLTLRTRV